MKSPFHPDMFDGLSLAPTYEQLEQIEQLQRSLTKLYAQVYAAIVAGHPCNIRYFASHKLAMVQVSENYEWTSADLYNIQWCITRLTRIYANLKERQTLGLHGVMEV